MRGYRYTGHRSGPQASQQGSEDRAIALRPVVAARWSASMAATNSATVSVRSLFGRDLGTFGRPITGMGLAPRSSRLMDAAGPDPLT